MLYYPGRVRCLRETSGLSRKELARRLGTDAAVVGRWERGEDAIPGDRLDPLSRLFGVSVSYVLGMDRVKPYMSPDEREDELAVLDELADQLADWVDRLPAASEWRKTLGAARANVLMFLEAFGDV